MSMLGGLGGSATFGLKLPARCIAAVLGQQHAAAEADAHHADADHGAHGLDGAMSPSAQAVAAATAAAAAASPGASHAPTHRFLVGTLSAKEDNEIHCIEFDEEENEIRSTAVFAHAPEIWHLSSCPSDASVCATTYAQDDVWQSSVWRMPSLVAGGAHGGDVPAAASPHRTGVMAQPLTRLFDLTGHVGRAKGVVWNPRRGENTIVSLDSQCLRVWELDEAAAQLKNPTATLSTPLEGGPSAAAWDPHHSRLLTSADGRHLRTWDLRASGAAAAAAAPTLSMEAAHEDLIRCVDYNPNRPHHLLSAGLDRRVHLWDLRAPAHPLKTLLHHTHWVWSARFNRFHDQLLLTVGGEMVNLWNLLSLSSAPVGELEHVATGGGSGGGAAAGGMDSLIKTYSDHEDSVYSAAWSAYDAWIFATLSYDGRICVNHVPPAEKYKILL